MRAPSGVRRTRSTTRSSASLVGTPVLLEVADQRRAEVARGLLAGVDGHVLAEDVERLLPDPERAPVGCPAHRAGARQLRRAALENRIHLAVLHDLVGELLRRELGAGQDRLTRAAVADEARQAQVR